MFQQKMAGNCLFVHSRTGENNLPVSDWLKNKYFPNILPIMASEQQKTVGTHIRKFSELHGNRDVIRIKNE
jgi:hypothetical protein